MQKASECRAKKAKHKSSRLDMFFFLLLMFCFVLAFCCSWIFSCVFFVCSRFGVVCDTLSGTERERDFNKINKIQRAATRYKNPVGSAGRENKSNNKLQRTESKWKSSTRKSVTLYRMPPAAGWKKWKKYQPKNEWKPIKLNANPVMRARVWIRSR